MTAPRRLRPIETDAPDREPAPAGTAARLRVALATQDMAAVNAHFAGARTLAVYEVSPQDWSLVEVTQFDTATDEAGSGRESDRVAPRLEALAGCALLFVRAIGGPAAARVVGAGVHPIKLAEDEAVEGVLTRVQAMLRSSPPPWLRRTMAAGRRASPTRFMDDDDLDHDTDPAGLPEEA